MKTLLLLFSLLISGVTYSQTTTESEIKNLSNLRIKALLESDISTLESIYDENSISIHSNGMVKTATEHLSDVKSGMPTYLSIDVKSQRVNDFGDAAVLVGTGDFKIKFQGQEMNYSMVYTEVYKKEDQGWKLIARHASSIQN